MTEPAERPTRVVVRLEYDGGARWEEITVLRPRDVICHVGLDQPAEDLGMHAGPVLIPDRTNGTGHLHLTLDAERSTDPAHRGAIFHAEISPPPGKEPPMEGSHDPDDPRPDLIWAPHPPGDPPGRPPGRVYRDPLWADKPVQPPVDGLDRRWQPGLWPALDRLRRALASERGQDLTPAAEALIAELDAASPPPDRQARMRRPG
jgi:hypothetical protein